MKNKKEIQHSDFDIEDMLRPKCSFHTSSGFKEKVMAEARTQAKQKSRKRSRITIAATVSAASVAALIAVAYLMHHDATGTQPDVMAEIVTAHTAEPPAGGNATVTATNVICPESTPGPKKTALRPIQRKSRGRSHLPADTTLPDSDNSGRQTETVIEGALRMASVISDSLPDPVKDRKRRLESRRREEIAYIEKTRDEIQVYDAYITQLKAYDNVYNSDTHFETPF